MDFSLHNMQAAFAALPRELTQRVQLFTLGEESDEPPEEDERPPASLEALMSDAKAKVRLRLTCIHASCCM